MAQHCWAVQSSLVAFLARVPLANWERGFQFRNSNPSLHISKTIAWGRSWWREGRETDLTGHERINENTKTDRPDIKTSAEKTERKHKGNEMNGLKSTWKEEDIDTNPHFRSLCLQLTRLWTSRSAVLDSRALLVQSHRQPFISKMLASFLQKEVCRVRVQSWLNMFAYLVNLGITYGSLTGAFGATNEELSEKYQSLVTPAGYAFAIWGAIFTWEGIFAVAQMFPSLSTSPVVDTVTPWWIFACCFQVAWTLFFAQDLIPGSLVCMLGILLSLVTAILRTDFLPEISLKEYFLLRAPFSLHCGWIIAASVLNINVLADAFMSSQETLLMLAMVPWQHLAARGGRHLCFSMCFIVFPFFVPGHGIRILSTSEHAVQHGSELLICSRNCYGPPLVVYCCILVWNLSMFFLRATVRFASPASPWSWPCSHLQLPGPTLWLV